MQPDATAIAQVKALRYGPPEEYNWSPRLRARFGLTTPTEWYEAVIFNLIDANTSWLDVGCGRSPFPYNRKAAEALSKRCRSLVGLDPSANIETNDIVHERVHSMLEDWDTDRTFDLITLRMVAEHIAAPEQAVQALSKFCRPGGRVVILTVSRWSPASIAAALTPTWFHQAVKSVIWGTDEEDTFPTCFRMNTRARLKELFEAEQFSETGFWLLDDPRFLSRWKFGTILELTIWAAMRGLGLHYPERNILGVYTRR